MNIEERQIEYVHYPFSEEDNIFCIGKMIEISSTEFAKQGSRQYIFDLIKDSYPVSDNVEVIEPIEIFETLQITGDGETGENLIILCRIKIRMIEA